MGDPGAPGRRAAPRGWATVKLPLTLRPWAGGALLWLTRAVGRIPSHALRNAYARRALGVTLGPGAVLYGWHDVRPGRITIGAGSIVGWDATLDGRAGIELGESVNLSSEVAIWTVEHDPNDPAFGSTRGSVRVGDRAWLSTRCVVLPGVTIGEGAVVAAGAVVTKDVRPYEIVAGIPAQRIGERRRDLTYDLAETAALRFI